MRSEKCRKFTEIRYDGGQWPRQIWVPFFLCSLNCGRCVDVCVFYMVIEKCVGYNNIPILLIIFNGVKTSLTWSLFGHSISFQTFGTGLKKMSYAMKQHAAVGKRIGFGFFAIANNNISREKKPFFSSHFDYACQKFSNIRRNEMQCECHTNRQLNVLIYIFIVPPLVSSKNFRSWFIRFMELAPSIWRIGHEFIWAKAIESHGVEETEKMLNQSVNSILRFVHFNLFLRQIYAKYWCQYWCQYVLVSILMMTTSICSRRLCETFIFSLDFVVLQHSPSKKCSKCFFVRTNFDRVATIRMEIRRCNCGGGVVSLCHAISNACIFGFNSIPRT